MTPEQLINIMENGGVVLNDVALIMGVSKRQVTSWRNGTHPIPRSVAILMMALNEGRIKLDWLEGKIQRELMEHV